MMENRVIDPLREIYLNNETYSGKQKRVVALILMVLLGMLTMIGYLFYQSIYPKEPKYYGVTPDGLQRALTDVRTPNMSPPTLTQWAMLAATSSYTFNYTNYGKNLRKISNYFTPSGWSDYLDALESSELIKDMQDKRVTISAIVTGAPVIVWQGTLPDGNYGWRLQLPLTVSYQSLSDIRSKSYVVTMLIVRVEPAYSPTGFGIQQFYTGNAVEII